MSRKTALFAVKTYNRLHYLHDCLSSFLLTRDPGFEWSIVVADDGSSDGTLSYLENFSAKIPVYLIRNVRRFAVGQANTIIDFFYGQGFDYGFCVDDDVFFKSSGWAQAYVQAMRQSGFSHLCYFDKNFATKAGKNSQPKLFVANGLEFSVYGGVASCMGCFFTFDRAVVEVVGYADEDNFPVHGQWHIDYSMRCCRAGFNSFDNFCDVNSSERWIGLQDHFSYNYFASEQRIYSGGKRKSAVEAARRSDVMLQSDRIYLARPYKGYVVERIC